MTFKQSKFNVWLGDSLAAAKELLAWGVALDLTETIRYSHATRIGLFLSDETFKLYGGPLAGRPP
ncbi:MAG: hypothetical protein WBO24_08225 [Nitrospirales bacterium]